MSARVLIVDDVEANLRLLEARLRAEYFEVLTASSGAEGLRQAREKSPDIVLLDVRMPDLDGIEVCARLKAESDTRHIPVILVTALDQRAARLAGLGAGADDFLTKPIDDVHLLARVKSLSRLKIVIDELRSHEATGARLGAIDAARRLDALEAHIEGPAHILIVDDEPVRAARIAAALTGEHRISRYEDEVRGSAPDLAIVTLEAVSFDGLRMIAKMAAAEPTRRLPVLAVAGAGQRDETLRAMELGAQDIIQRPVDKDELAARVRTLVKRKRYMDALRARLDSGLELAVKDQLTGLFNRRYLAAQLGPLALRAACGGDPVSVLLIDLDHFKRINDAHGHDAGDLVLREFARRLLANVRPCDFACRMGGEEFAVVMPNTTGDLACLAAERIRRQVAGAPVRVSGAGAPLGMTVSIGVATTEGRDESAESLLKRADQALYEAKRAGRNRVVGRSAMQAA
jgi:two-component system cell cycle response regulator